MHVFLGEMIKVADELVKHRLPLQNKRVFVKHGYG